MDKCKKCHDGEMVLKVEDEELQYHECNSCGFDIVSYELMVERNAIVKEARQDVCEARLYLPQKVMKLGIRIWK